MPKKKKRKPKSKKLIPLNVKALGSDISAYPFVEIEWSDIEGMRVGVLQKIKQRKITYMCIQRLSC
jgi:hypothetical protein